jgi:uncharacterized oxidoreductase
MQRIDPAPLRSLARELVIAFGAPPDVAERVAQSLVDADLVGHGSHGVIRIPTLYRKLVDDGQLDPTATPSVGRVEGATATVEGNFSFGQVVGRRAADLAVELAADAGVAAVGVRDANHIGRVGEWAERATDHGMLFAAFVNLGGMGSLVAPPGSATRRLGTNPLAFGVPAYDALEYPIVLDMATSQVAHGKVAKRNVDDKPIPEGWAVAPSGEPLTDAAAFEDGDGALLPVGGLVSGYKGFGLSVIAELFAGVVGDAMVCGQGETGRVNNAAAFVAIDPQRFTTPEAVANRVADLAAYLRDAEFSDDVPTGSASHEDALLPGEAEYRNRRERESEGIPMEEGTLRALADFAAEVGAEDAVPDSFPA